jgi:hypothetical protein
MEENVGSVPGYISIWSKNSIAGIGFSSFSISEVLLLAVIEDDEGGTRRRRSAW